jgi:hypothetical protein
MDSLSPLEILQLYYKAPHNWKQVRKGDSEWSKSAIFAAEVSMWENIIIIIKRMQHLFCRLEGNWPRS